MQLLESYLSDRTADEYVSEPSNHLDSPTSLETSQLVSPISEICKNLELCSLSDIGCRKVSLKSNYFAVTDKTREIVPDAKFYHSPFLCVERSCELFAHRICNDILGSLEPDCPGAIVMLSTQVKQLRLLMASFMSDPRFASVLFEVAHHRLGALISTKLLAILNDDDEYNLTKQTLVAWFEECGKSFDCFSSDDESPNNQQTAANHIKCTSNIKQVMCLLNCILGALGEPAQLPVKLSTEDECKTAWEDTKRCECVWMRQSESFVRKKNFQDYRRKLFVDDEEDCVDGKSKLKLQTERKHSIV